jgi:hypothetical protein
MAPAQLLLFRTSRESLASCVVFLILSSKHAPRTRLRESRFSNHIVLIQHVLLYEPLTPLFPPQRRKRPPDVRYIVYWPHNPFPDIHLHPPRPRASSQPSGRPTPTRSNPRPHSAVRPRPGPRSGSRPHLCYQPKKQHPHGEDAAESQGRLRTAPWRIHA